MIELNKMNIRKSESTVHNYFTLKKVLRIQMPLTSQCTNGMRMAESWL